MALMAKAVNGLGGTRGEDYRELTSVCMTRVQISEKNGWTITVDLQTKELHQKIGSRAGR